MGQSIVVCGRKVDIGAPVVLWDGEGGLPCPHPRGRATCAAHDPALNDAPTQPFSRYVFQDKDAAYAQLQAAVHQFVIHYDVCYTAYHCHQLLSASEFKGSHFYLDVDGTVYQTCDLYWKTNTAPADDRAGNERAVHVEMSNLSWEARAAESELYKVEKDQYRNVRGRWRLLLPPDYQKRLRLPDFTPYAARGHGQRGYFSRRVNGKVVRMWDFTEEQYQSLIRLCVGVHTLLPRVRLRVPYDRRQRAVPLSRIDDFAGFSGILGHAHVQKGAAPGVAVKYDPGSAFDWRRLRRALDAEEKRARHGANAAAVDAKSC